MPRGVYVRTEKEKERLRKIGKKESTKIKTLCKRCGKEIYVFPRKFKEKGNFCSKDCSNKYHSKMMSEKMKGRKVTEATKNKLRQYIGENTSGWKGGKPKCKICGKEINYKATYCLKHKHLLWTKEKWEKFQKGSMINKIGKMPKNMQIEGKWRNIKRGIYNINGKKIFLRSKWEANYALYLDFLIKHKQIKKWTYEEDVFIFEKIKYGTRSYRPDFKVFNDDKTIEYHEIKGYMTPKSKTQIKRMVKYYPNIKLIIIDQYIYKDIESKLGKMLKFY